ncbi:DGKA kinase, partial [Pterocles burchelli]|nr:DGKA kinase [Pterocles burchelli]
RRATGISVSQACRRRVAAMTESRDWATLSPQEFAQLQKYLDYSSRKVQDVLRDFDRDGALAQHRQGESLDFEGFTVFLRSYLEVNDIPEPLVRHLFASFQSEGSGAGEGGPRGMLVGGQGAALPPGGGSSGSFPTGTNLVCISDVSCYFSLLEGGRPEDKLEFTFKLYDKDGNGLLDSSVSAGGCGWTP